MRPYFVRFALPFLAFCLISCGTTKVVVSDGSSDVETSSTTTTTVTVNRSSSDK